MTRPKAQSPDRTIVLVGLMGAGKTCIGKKLAKRLGMAFADADDAIEAAAGRTIPEIFAELGEAAFREGERKVIARLLEKAPHVLATGGGAFMDPTTRAKIKEDAISIWLRADLDILLKRTARRNNRPLLNQGDRRQVLEDLIAKRYPVYAEADITVDSADLPADVTVDRVIGALNAHLAGKQRRALAS